MKGRALLLALSVAALAPSGALGQTFTGSIEGTVLDEQGGALPGGTVTLAAKTGVKITVTGSDGTYRFAALDPGLYDVTAEVAGFHSLRRENVKVAIGITARIDFTLKLGELKETVEVAGEAPVVDTTASATDNSLSQSLLFNMPIRGGNAAQNLLNVLPGVNNQSAYGGDAASGNGLLIDGVDTRDPSGGTAWTFYNYNIVEEVQAVGIGASAEYGAFSGAVINTVTKSGGNRYSGLFDIIYTQGGLASDNVSAEAIAQNPTLAQPGDVRELVDFTTQLGGPILKDKLFFFASAQRYSINQDPSGPRTIRSEISPRFNLKLTWQPSVQDALSGQIQYDQYNQIGRPGVGELASTDATSNREAAPEWVWLFYWRHLFGSKTFTEVRYTGWTGYYDLNPEVTAPGHYDAKLSLYSVSQGWFSYADRGRNQVNASVVSHFADKWGKHELKFGVEIERSSTRDRFGYTNSTYYYDSGGQPYYAYSYGYDVSGLNHRQSVYLQDAWKPTARLTLNLGVRMDHMTGGAPDADPVYSNTVVAPRLGFAFDLTGKNNTVLKGSYGQYYEGIFNDLYKIATPGYIDRVTWDMSQCPPYDPGGPTADYRCPLAQRIEETRLPKPATTIDSDIGHPRVDEISLGFERAIGRSVRVAVTGVYRANKNFVGSVLPLATWLPKTVTTGSAPTFPSQSLTVYDWANRAESRNTLLITNPDGFSFRDPAGSVLGTLDAERKYRALMVVLSKSYGNRWQGQLSYVLSRSDGTIDNTAESLFGPTRFYQTPTLALVNTNGLLTNDRTSELKIMAGYRIPKAELQVNAFWRTLSGRPYTPVQRFPAGSGNPDSIDFASFYFLASPGRTPLLEARGSRRLPTQNVLDLRLEKVFAIGRRNQIAVYADIANAFNAGTVTAVQDRVPSQDLTVAPGELATVVFEAPGIITPARQVTLGARWSF